MIDLDQQTPSEIAAALAQRVRARRKELKLTQVQMSQKAGMSLGSYKRFEQTHQISLESLIRISIALSCEDDFDALFAKRQYASIQDVINARR
ncbi:MULTISPECIES: helix-turn-helix domain-containing protein [unclassified Adlercreutzia]|uniref:helix-turn-helix domain-containing protein n=1 Tax=unclassified Adlercreutzia TaxID=2636013 RepID=UPI0013EB400F|nr:MULTISPECIES: helix-turn-helix transcriptional regulator [unclassified Adlercreutzia]